jgi:Ser-tRNA(Ala) deacylase AlaX
MTVNFHSPAYRVYYQDTYQDKLNGASVLSAGKDDKGNYISLDKTLFHPQGGGQPSDEGNIILSDGTKVKIVALSENKTTGEIFHYHQSDVNAFKINQLVNMEIDLEKRKLFAKLHTGGHLIANLMEKEYKLEGYKGNHFPGGQAWVVFKGSPMPDKAIAEKKLVTLLEQAIADNLPISITYPVDSVKGAVRTLQIGHNSTYPCGGTHLKSTKELEGTIVVRNIKIQKGEMRVGYDVK